MKDADLILICRLWDFKSRLLHTWTGVVVDLICRDSNICILSFSLNDAQLLLGGVGVGEPARTRLCLELDQQSNSVNLLKIRYSKSQPLIGM